MGMIGVVVVLFLFGIIMLLAGLGQLSQVDDLMNIWCGSDCGPGESAGTLIVAGIVILALGGFVIKRVWF